MKVLATTNGIVADLSEAMFQKLDMTSKILANTGYGIVGDLTTELKVSVSQAQAHMQVTAGSFITPDGTTGTFDELVSAVFPHSREAGATGVVLATYSTAENSATDEYKRNIVAGETTTVSIQCVSLDEYGDNKASIYPVSVVLAVYSILDGAIELDETSNVVAHTRKQAGATDIAHRVTGYATYQTQRNPHGVQLDELYAGDVSLLKQASDGGYILGNNPESQGTPGNLVEVEVLTSSWRVDYLGEVTGKPGTYYALLPSTPTAFGTAVDAKYMDVPADVDWLEKQNIITTTDPGHVVVRYSALPDLDLCSPIVSSALSVNTNTTQIIVSEGKLRHTQEKSRITAGLDKFQDLSLHEVTAHLNKGGSLVLCPSVVESTTVSASLSGTSLTSKVGFPVPSQVTFAVRGAGLATAQEPPAGQIKVTSNRFIGTSNFTFTVENDEERTQLAVSVGNTVVLSSASPLHPCGFLAKNSKEMSSIQWRRVDDYTVAVIPVAHSDGATYEWVLPAGESPRWLGRSIQATGKNVPPKVARAQAWLHIVSTPLDGDSITVETAEDEITLTYGTEWGHGTSLTLVANHLASAINKSTLATEMTASTVVDGSNLFVRILSKSLAADSNNWSVSSSAGSVQVASFYGGGSYAPHAYDLVGLGISVMYQQTPYVKKPRINVYATKNLVDEYAVSDKGIFHKIYQFDASDKRTRWYGHTLTRSDLVMSDYADRNTLDTTAMFSLGLTVVGYDANGSQVNETVTIDDVDAWSPKSGYSDLAFKSTANVYSAITSWIVSKTPPSVSNTKLYVLANMYDAPTDMAPVRSFQLLGGAARNVRDTRRIRLGNKIANEPSEQEKLHQAFTMQSTVLKVGGLL